MIKILKNLPIQGPHSCAMASHNNHDAFMPYFLFYLTILCELHGNYATQFNSRGQCFHLEDASGLKLCSLSVHLLNVFYLYLFMNFILGSIDILSNVTTVSV